MKKFARSCGIAALLAFSSVQVSTGAASSIDTGGRARELLQDLAAMTIKCAIHPYSIDLTGKKIYYPLQSRCPQLRITSPSTALIYLERQTYYAELLESRDSDGGDLDDLFILDAYGHRVAMRHNVAAFDDILLSLAGGREQEIPEVRK
jgi:hypothetical protein